MREAIGMQGIMYIIIVLLLLFTGFLCLSINFTSAFKVTDSIVNQINKDEGVDLENIASLLSEVGYTSKGDCCESEADSSDPCGGWQAFSIKTASKATTGTEGNFCIKRVKSSSDNPTIPQMYYYRIKTFYTVEIPLLNRLNLNVQANTSVIYSPEADDLEIFGS